jgi:flavin reductase (DIM6/NTAB) family NADH-FMN oxidoreductase RutF
MELDPADRDAAYRALTSVVAPRPIGWISTVDAAGVDNLAPFSFFNAVSSRPPAVAFSPGDRDGTLKDTPRNALDTGEFVVNLATEDLIEDVDRTSVDAAGSEFDLAGLEREPSVVVDPPRVAESPAALECTVLDSLRVGDAATLVLGEVVHISVDEDLLTDGAVDAREVESVGRLGGPYYGRVDVMEFERRY